MHQYPAYRKYTGIDVWFKITSDRHFIELKKMGQRWIKHEVVAEQYPEIVFIQDMLSMLDGRWEIHEGELFEDVLVSLD